MVNAVNTARDKSESTKKPLSFAAHKELLKTFTKLADDTAVDSLIADMDQIGAGFENDPAFIQSVAKLNNIDPIRLETAIRIIRQKTDGAKPELSTSTIDANVAEKQPETQEQTITRLLEENRKKDRQLKTIEPAVISIELATNPTKIPRFLRQKMRNRMISRKQRDPYELLYYLRDGQMRRFKRTKKRMENIDRVYRDLTLKYGPDAQANEKFVHQKRTMEKRWEVIQEAYKAVQNIKPKKVQL